MTTCPPECPPHLRDKYMDYISRPDAIKTPAAIAYDQGKSDFADGVKRTAGSQKFYGSQLFSWIEGWDDAAEQAADEVATKAEMILPLVAVGGGE